MLTYRALDHFRIFPSPSLRISPSIFMETGELAGFGKCYRKRFAVAVGSI